MKQDLQQLAERHDKNPSPENRDALVRAALPFVRSLVSRANVPSHVLTSREDLEHVGFLGLLQALDSYDPGRGTPFVSYAYGRVHGAIVDYLRSIDTLPRERRRQLAKAQQASERLSQELGAEPTDQDVAGHLGISLEDYHHILHISQRRYALSLHAHSEDDEKRNVLDTLSDARAERDFNQLEEDSVHEFVSELMQGLPEREQTILGLYYFENLRLKEIAQLLDLTEARISQILSRTRRRLREQLLERQVVAA